MTTYTLFRDNGSGQYVPDGHKIVVVSHDCVTDGHTVVIVSHDCETPPESLDGVAKGNFNSEFFEDLITNSSEHDVFPLAEMFGGRYGPALDDFNHRIIDEITI